MRSINEIIIHCADTPNGKEFHNTDIDRWHKERGWSGIGYHYVICIDGSVEPGRPLEVSGAHAEGHNSKSIGICLIGKNRFTPAQWEALKELVKDLEEDWPAAKVIGHYEVASNGKTCPNFNVSDWSHAYLPDVNHVL
jgi:N-acetyl-anhydromuramyl-L-alanine amidase AmpD